MGNSRPRPGPTDDQRDGRSAGERDQAAGARERALDDREARADRRDAARAKARQGERDILDAADVRDGRADDRDSLADKRDTEADRLAFLTSSGYGEDLPARRHAAVDRSQSRDDRTSAASDRSRLAGDGADEATADEAADDARASDANVSGAKATDVRHPGEAEDSGAHGSD